MLCCGSNCTVYNCDSVRSLFLVFAVVSVYIVGVPEFKAEMLRRILSCFLAVMWLGIANHCYAVDAMRKVAAPSEHCSDHSGKHKSTEPTGPHGRCTQGVCCELFVQGVSNAPDAFASTSPISYLGLPAFYVFVVSFPFLRERSVPLPDSLGPPGGENRILSSLSVAQNAPPFSLI